MTAPIGQRCWPRRGWGRRRHLFDDGIQLFLADAAGGLGRVPELDQGNDRPDHPVARDRLGVS